MERWLLYECEQVYASADCSKEVEMFSAGMGGVLSSTESTTVASGVKLNLMDLWGVTTMWNVTEFWNVTNVTAVFDPGEWDVVTDQFRLVFQIVNFVFICEIIDLFGTGTNIVNIVCFAKQGLKDPVNISLLGDCDCE